MVYYLIISPKARFHCSPPHNFRYVIGITVFYLIGQLVQASIPYWYGKKYGYYTQYVQCMWFTTQVFEAF